MSVKQEKSIALYFYFFMKIKLLMKSIGFVN